MAKFRPDELFVLVIWPAPWLDPEIALISPDMVELCEAAADYPDAHRAEVFDFNVACTVIRED